ncbi:hypothetical protein ALI144C_25220 [Actinosynnema sp. ALI-1.44]|nr:hypothetical protein ALI144C_25220 [Actinosynnema sp. ALI-1.44]
MTSARADFSLELQLELVEKQAAAPDVKDAIAAVVQHMHSGRTRNRRGGRKLIDLLEVARLRASEEPEWHVVRLLQDSIDFASGRLLKGSFEENYRLFQDGARNENSRNYVAKIVGSLSDFTVRTAQEFLAGRPDATAAELLDHLSGLFRDARFLDAPDDRLGRYRIVRGRAETALWLERVLRDRIDVENPAETAARLVVSPAALEVLAKDEDGQASLKAVELKKRSDSLAAIRAVVQDRIATESHLQRVLWNQSWIFGGRFVGVAARRRLVPGDEVDIPLIRADGSLHIVEIKRSMAARPIVKRHRGAWVPTAEVHDAVAQGLNYLVGLDENRQSILDEFGIETRRSSVTVLVGHPAMHPDIPETEINEVFRTLNNHLSRVEVLTYKELVDNAQRALTYPDSDS